VKLSTKLGVKRGPTKNLGANGPPRLPLLPPLTVTLPNLKSRKMNLKSLWIHTAFILLNVILWKPRYWRLSCLFPSLWSYRPETVWIEGAIV